MIAESNPTAFAPNDFRIQDFALEWVGPAPAGVKASLPVGSLQWVRVSDILVLPRGTLTISLEPGVTGTIQSGGVTHPLSATLSKTGFEIPIPLLSGPGNPIELTIRHSDGKESRAELRVRFQPKTPRAISQRLLIDTSCSRYGLRLASSPSIQTAIQPDRWAYIGCRHILNESARGRTQEIEAWIYWDGDESALELNRLKAAPASPHLWIVRLPSKPGQVELQASSNRAVFRYQVAERFHPFSLGMGFGPYAYHYTTDNESKRTINPVLTLYASYFVSETSRIVVFDASVIGSRGYTDVGLYWGSESVKALDRRLTINFYFGAHLLILNTAEGTFPKFGLPQGFEFIYSDAFQRGRNLSAGGFIYPLIAGKSYYNLWLRWGGRIFGEINYLAWNEQVQGAPVSTQSVGLSLGIPLLSLF